MPRRSGKPRGLTGWAYCARTPSRDLFLLYFEKSCPQATLSGLRPRVPYHARWFNPRTGEWLAKPTSLTADASGKATLPRFPGGKPRSDTDWALKLTLWAARDHVP